MGDWTTLLGPHLPEVSLTDAEQPRDLGKIRWLCGHGMGAYLPQGRTKLRLRCGSARESILTLNKFHCALLSALGNNRRLRDMEADEADSLYDTGQ